MSGGSFNYVGRSYDRHELIGKLHELRGLREALAKLPGSAPALAATDRFLALADALEGAAAAIVEADTPLKAVWHAVEWHASGDFGDDTVAEVLAAFDAAARSTRRPPTPDEIQDVIERHFPDGDAPGLVYGDNRCPTGITGGRRVPMTGLRWEQQIAERFRQERARLAARAAQLDGAIAALEGSAER